MTERRPLRISADLSLPIEAVTETFAILAKRGAGKTYTAKVLAEELLKAGLPLAVIDPVGVWWGLRAGADGDPAGGYPVTILGGDHGDLPLEVDAGEMVADLVVDERVPVVLDLSSFRKGEARRFVTAFAERLYHRNREPLHLLIDEADAFAPQRSPKGDEARLLGAIEDLVRRGRARGIGVTLVTQRAAVINKNVLTQAEVLIALRTTSPQDRAAIDAWVDVHADGVGAYDEVAASLPSLAIGEAWVWSPGWLDLLARVRIRTARTFDSSATPKAGAKITPPRRLADVDLEDLRGRMAASIERAKADDPKALRARIGELERDLTTAHRNLDTERAAKPAPIEVPVEVPVLSDELTARLEAALGSWSNTRDVILATFGTAEDVAGMVREVLAARDAFTVPRPSTPVAAPGPPPAAPASTPARDIPRERAETDDELVLHAGARRLLEVIGAHPGGLTKAQAATLAKLKVSGGTYQTYLSKLKTNGLVVVDGRLVRPTAEGIALAGNPLPPSPAETLAAWRDRLGATSGARRMLDALVERYPLGLTKQDLGVEANLEVSGGSFQTYLSRLRTNGLVEERDGELFAAELIGAAA